MVLPLVTSQGVEVSEARQSDFFRNALQLNSVSLITSPATEMNTRVMIMIFMKMTGKVSLSWEP